MTITAVLKSEQARLAEDIAIAEREKKAREESKRAVSFRPLMIIGEASSLLQITF